MHDFSKQAKLDTINYKLYKKMQNILYFAAVIFALYFSFLILFPSSFFAFNFSSPSSLKNTIISPRYEDSSYAEHGKILNNQKMLFDTALVGNYGKVKVEITMDKKSDPPERYDGEYSEYLHSYVDNNFVFTKEAMDKELAKLTDTIGAFDFAIQRELDSILYYHEIKKLVPEGQHAAIDQIIDEERKHFTLLANMKKRFIS